MALTIKQIERALRSNGGFISRAAKMLGVTHQAISYRIQKSPELKKVKEEIENEYLDLAEAQLIEAIRNSEPWAICFFLKCKGKKRGYVEKMTYGTESNEPLKINVTVDSD